MPSILLYNTQQAPVIFY